MINTNMCYKTLLIRRNKEKRTRINMKCHLTCFNSSNFILSKRKVSLGRNVYLSTVFNSIEMNKSLYMYNIYKTFLLSSTVFTMSRFVIYYRMLN